MRGDYSLPFIYDSHFPLKTIQGSSHCGTEETNPTSIHEDTTSILGLSHWLRIQCCRELWCRSQTWLRSCIAVAGSCSFDSTPSLGISICCECGPKKKKRKKHRGASWLKGSGIVTAVMWVRSLTQEFPHAVGVTKTNKQTKKHLDNIYPQEGCSFKFI